MQGVTLNYEAAMTGVGNYLCAQVEGKINNYQMKMLENNEIPGLLAARGSMFNGVYRIHYEIDDTRRLGAVLASGGLRGEEAKRFMGGLLRALSGLGEYFLSYRQCLLDMDYIYMDKRGRAKLAYLPLDRQAVTDEEGVRLFCQKLFAEHFTADGDPFFLKLLRYVSMQDFSFSGLLGWFEEEKEEVSAQATGQASIGGGINPQTAQVPSGGQGMQAGIFVPGEKTPQEAPAPEKKKFSLSGRIGVGSTPSGSAGSQKENAGNKSADNGMNSAVAGTGFAIPGGGFSVPQTAEAEKKKEDKKGEKEKKQKEKGASLFKSLLGGKKDKAEEKAEGQSSIPAPSTAGGMGAGHQNSGNGNAFSGTGAAGSASSGAWQGTVMLGGEETGSSTVMLGAEAAPYLMYQGLKISLEHFPFTFGKENTDYVFNKNVVSRMHASIHCRDGVYFVMDENSKNHTYLNGKQLSPYTEAMLQDGDTLKFASEVLTFHV